jgi:hypothetical protein
MRLTVHLQDQQQTEVTVWRGIKLNPKRTLALTIDGFEHAFNEDVEDELTKFVALNVRRNNEPWRALAETDQSRPLFAYFQTGDSVFISGVFLPKKYVLGKVGH